MMQGEVYTSTITISELEHMVLSYEGNTARCMSTTVEEKELGLEHPDNRIVKRFLGGHITNDWKVLLQKTMVYFQWVAKTRRNWTGDESKSAYHMAMMFWIKQAMPATWKAFDDKKLDKLTVWKKEGMLMVTGRALKGLQHYFGVDYLPVLMSSSRVT